MRHSQQAAASRTALGAEHPMSRSVNSVIGTAAVHQPHKTMGAPAVLAASLWRAGQLRSAIAHELPPLYIVAASRTPRVQAAQDDRRTNFSETARF
ncbi:hypothetical protein PHYPSEUDO_011150, partial [Phytophthora pseudosyringae]